MAGVDLSYDGTAFPRAQEVREFLYQNAGEGVSPRYRRLDRRDAFFRCVEYDHLDTDWNGKPADMLETISPNVLTPYGYTQPALEKSARERRPTSPLRLVPLIVDRFSDLLFSEDRIPEITVEGDEDADDFVREVFDKFGFWSKMYEARGFGGAMGSALVTVHVKDGRFVFRAHSPKTVHDIIWQDRDQLIPAGVLIQYLTVKEFEVLDENGRATGKIEERAFVYRRIIDAEYDIVFKEAPLDDDGRPPAEMEIDDQASQHHKLGRFPGVWIQNLPCADDIDGVPDCEGAYQLIDTIDRLNSQANFALMANMDPTLVMSRDVRRVKGAIRKGSRNALEVGLQGSASYLEISAAGIVAARDLMKDLRQAVLDKTACIIPGPEEQAAGQSAKAIEFRYAPMLAKGGRLRVQWGTGIRTLAEVTLELGRHWSDPKQYDGNAVPVFDLPKRVVEIDRAPTDPNVEPVQVERARHPGRGGRVALRWGRWFAPTPNDVQTDVQTLVQARDGGVIDSEEVVRQGAPLFGVRDVKGMIRRVQEEQAEREEKQAALLAQAAPLGGESDLAAEYERQQQAPAPPEDEPTPMAGEGGQP